MSQYYIKVRCYMSLLLTLLQTFCVFYIIPTRCTCNKQCLFNLTTALHVLGVTITHLQEHKTTVTTASGNRYTLLLSATVVEEMELV
jgi:hypothetical protein